MKKIISIALSLALVLLVVPMAIMAEGATLTVGANGDYATIAEAVKAASAGDTIKLVEDVQQDATITISKALTIDTNGFVWRIGATTADKPKVDCANLSADVTIINSKRTTQVTKDDSFDILANPNKHSSAFIINSNDITVTFRNVAFNSTNAYPNNQAGAIISSGKTATVNIENCYMSSKKYAPIINRKSALTLTAENSIFGGDIGAYAIVDGDIGSVLYFKNCEFLNTIGSAAQGATNVTSGTASLSSLNITLEDCTGTGIYGPDANVKFVGTNAFTNVYAGVVVSAGEGTTLYADSAYTTEVASGTITANTAIYSKGEGTDEEESSSEALEPEEPSSEPEVPSESESTTTTTTTVPTPSTPVEPGTLTVGATLGQYKTIAEAVAAANDGDTIKLVENVTEVNITIAKAVTIDTNGFVWTGGTSSKQNCASIKADGVTIKNSQRTTPVTADATPDVVANSANRQGVFAVDTSKITVNFENVVIKSTNAYVNNQGCAVYAYDKTITVNVKNCFFLSANYGAIVMNKVALTLNAEDSIFAGPQGTFVTVGSDKGSNISFKNCEFGSVVGYAAGNISSSATDGTADLSNRVITLEGCTGEGIYGPGSTAKFVGTNAFTTVYAGVKVSCADGDAIYTDADYVNQLVSGTVLEADSAIYSKTLPTEFHIYIDGEKYATVDVGASIALPVSQDKGLIAYTDGTTYYAENQVVTPEINMNLTSVSIGDVKMLQGASMKLNVATGLRFYTQIDIEKINALQEDGAVISMG
ncbi:MAG: hypothetical protein IIU65_00180, partial [Clostridia bacterium]|nr:hypothetical protein [Clostridia bacterium]